MRSLCIPLTLLQAQVLFHCQYFDTQIICKAVYMAVMLLLAVTTSSKMESIDTETRIKSIICCVCCSENMGIYDDIDADVLRNYQEFSLVNIIYYGMKESTTSEQSARMTAMDNASKNACETFYMSSSFQFLRTFMALYPYMITIINRNLCSLVPFSVFLILQSFIFPIHQLILLKS